MFEIYYIGVSQCLGLHFIIIFFTDSLMGLSSAPSLPPSILVFISSLHPAVAASLSPSLHQTNNTWFNTWGTRRYEPTSRTSQTQQSRSAWPPVDPLIQLYNYKRRSPQTSEQSPSKYTRGTEVGGGRNQIKRALGFIKCFLIRG